MKNLRFSSRPRAKVRRQGPPGVARAQPWVYCSLCVLWSVTNFACKLHRFVTGVIARERVPTFERLLWRACRGNVFFKQAEIETPLEDPSTGDQVNKCVFIIFFQGDQLKSRVKKICEG